jgi:tRNA nucleotidyltransferase/poly(A) polymerase
MKALKIIQDMKCFQELQSLGAEIFLVGGIVRDHFLNKESKDIDLVIRLLDLDTIQTVLNKHGKCKQEGANFPVLKFKPNGWEGDDIDVALPRKDRKATDEELETLDKRSRGIVAKCDPNLSIEEDLIRRDFTINSIAMKMDGTIIDPFNGLEDMKKSILRATSLEAFIDDPLRMVRLIQFASRFEFDIEERTLDLLKEHKSRIKNVSKERFLEEFRKMFDKGDILFGFNLFRDLGLDVEITGFKNTTFEHNIRNISTIADFFFCLLDGESTQRKDILFRECFKGSKVLANEIFAISLGVEETVPNALKSKRTALRMFSISSNSLMSGIISPFVKSAFDEILEDELPKGINELDINGNDLQKIGFKGKDIKDRQEFLLDEVLMKRRENTKEDLLWVE